MWDATVFCKAQARKNKQDKCESLNRVKKVLPSLAPFQLGIFSNVAGSPHGDVVFDWVVNCVTAIAQGLVDGKIFAKIEWKDTSKNPTGSKNNSLSE